MKWVLNRIASENLIFSAFPKRFASANQDFRQKSVFVVFQYGIWNLFIIMYWL